jgi:hypothetical protein
MVKVSKFNGFCFLTLKKNNMKKIFMIWVLMLGMISAARSQLFIDQDATLSLSGVDLCLHNLSLINNGTFIPGISNVYVIQEGTNADLSISGDALTTEFDWLLVRTGDQNLILEQDILVRGRVFFESGNLDLNFQTARIGPFGIIVDESEESSFIGPNGGEISHQTSLDAPMNENPANLGATITSNANLGDVTIIRRHVPISSGNGQSIGRTFSILPTNNQGLDATLRVSYLDKELNGTSESDLSMWQENFSTSTWENFGYDDRDPTNNWVEVSGINEFTEVTLGNAGFTPVINLDQGLSLQIGDVFPNPIGVSASIFQFPVRSPITTDIDIRVIDQLGRSVHESSVSIQPGDQMISLDKQNWGAGLYFLHLTVGENSTQLKLLIQ